MDLTGPDPVTEVSVDIKIDVQWVGLDLGESSLCSTDWSRA